MPTFQCNPVYRAVESNLSYISDTEKQIPESDVMRVLAYMNGEHAESMYTKGYNCSSNPTLATQEFLSDREKYFACHKSKRLSGQGKGKKEILSHHVYVSFSEFDPVTTELLMQIADDFIGKMNLQGFRIFVAPHLNTKHRHFHMSISSYRMDGKCKFYMKNDIRYRCQMALNQIAADYGLSIIDHQKLRVWAEKNQPEYVEWLEGVKKEGKICVLENSTLEEKFRRAEARKEQNKARNKEKNKHEKPIKKQIQAAVRENTKKDVFESREYYTAEGRFPNVWKPNRPYRIGLYSDTGRRRGTLELLLLLIATIFVDTEKYARENRYYRPSAEPAWEIQRMIDSVHLIQIYQVSSVQDLKNKTYEVESWLESHTKAMAYIAKQITIEDSEMLRERWQWHREQYGKYRKQYQDLMVIKETLYEVSGEQYKYRIYDFEPIEAKENSSKRKLPLDILIRDAQKIASNCLVVEEQRVSRSATR